MMNAHWFVWLLFGVIGLGLLVGLGSQLSRDARLRRRRRKSNSPVVSTARRPMVRFSVKPPKE
ncbi:MAG: hypothetical protein DME25_13980 [Verrucomicrobia bacterium]|nr:MAG: hypothetical protein DME25_13980 [Verrucomicrobiota bacterium]